MTHPSDSTSSTSRATHEPLGLRRLLRERQRFGAYARLVQVAHELQGGIYPALVRMQKLLDEEVAPVLAEAEADAEFAALLMHVRNSVASPARLLEALLGALAQYHELLPDLYSNSNNDSQSKDDAATDEAVNAEVLPGPGYRAE